MTTSFYSALNYGDLLYGQPYNESFCKKIESLQIQTCSGWGISKIYQSQIKIYEELCLKSLNDNSMIYII